MAKPDTKIVASRVRVETEQALRSLAEAQDRPLSTYLRRLIERHVRQHESAAV